MSIPMPITAANLHSRIVWFFGLALVFSSLASPARADGIILPLVAAPAVTMPDQRALLVWHERTHTETLVIESRFTGQGRDFAWIVPLPSRPVIKAATLGTLPALATQFRPKVGDDRPDSMGGFFVILLVPGSLFLLFGRRKAAKHVFLLCVPISLLFAMSIPSFGVTGAPTANSFAVEREVVGDYDVATLSGGTTDNIATWLRDNRFALPAAAEPVVAEHVKAGGSFVAARLRRPVDETKISATAPLVFTFKTPAPFYPMKLTGAGTARPLSVELYVFSNARAEADGLEAPICAQVEFGQGFLHNHIRAIESEANAQGILISHSALRDLCAGTSIGTLLAGTLPPTQMKHDLLIRWEPFREAIYPIRYTAKGAIWNGAFWTTMVLFFAAVAAKLLWRKQRPPFWVGWISLVAAGATGCIFWLLSPTISVLPDMLQSKRTIVRTGHIILDDLQATEQSEAALREKFSRQFASRMREAHFDPPNEGDAPGEYSLRKMPDGNLRFIWIDELGQELF